MPAPTPEELDAALEEHPELVDRLVAGDTSALEDIFEVVGGAKVGEVTVRMVEDRRVEVTHPVAAD